MMGIVHGALRRDLLRTRDALTRPSGRRWSRSTTSSRSRWPAGNGGALAAGWDRRRGLPGGGPHGRSGAAVHLVAWFRTRVPAPSPAAMAAGHSAWAGSCPL